MTDSPAAWLEAHCLGAPADLHRRVGRYFAMAPVGLPLPERLGEAGLIALQATLESAGERPAALDLLAADALVTLALQAVAEHDPAALSGLAGYLRHAGAGVA